MGETRIQQHHVLTADIMGD